MSHTSAIKKGSRFEFLILKKRNLVPKPTKLQHWTLILVEPSELSGNKHFFRISNLIQINSLQIYSSQFKSDR